MMDKVSLIALAIGMSCTSQAEYGTSLGDAPLVRRSTTPSKAQEQALTVEMLSSPAKHGDANAQYRLGIVYRDGLGVKRSDTTAFRWFQKAAAQGNIDASFALGLLYADWEESENALRWLDVAAQKGHEGAKHAYDYMLNHDFGYGC